MFLSIGQSLVLICIAYFTRSFAYPYLAAESQDATTVAVPIQPSVNAERMTQTAEFSRDFSKALKGIKQSKRDGGYFPDFGIVGRTAVGEALGNYRLAVELVNDPWGPGKKKRASLDIPFNGAQWFNMRQPVSESMNKVQ